MTICWTVGRAPAGFEQRPGAADVRVERRDRIPVRHADGRLRRQVEDGRDLVLAERALERLLIADVAAHDPDPVEQSGRRRAPSAAPSRAPGRRRRRRQRASCRTSQPPRRPVAPVTKTGRSRQNDGGVADAAIPRRQCESPPEPCRARAGRGRWPAASAADPRCSNVALERAPQRAARSRRPRRRPIVAAQPGDAPASSTK